eukprot:2264060-Pleurochrysis_carterae.AAC.1
MDGMGCRISEAWARGQGEACWTKRHTGAGGHLGGSSAWQVGDAEAAALLLALRRHEVQLRKGELAAERRDAARQEQSGR